MIRLSVVAAVWLVLALGAGAARATDTPADTATATGTAPAAESAGGGSAADATPANPVPAAPSTAPARAEPLRLDPPRTSLLPLVQPLWSELSAPQQAVLAPFASQWNALPLTEKRAWADLAKRFPKMKPDEQKRVEKRIAEWAELTAEQRRIARANFRLAQQVARDNSLLAEWENYQSMTPDQRSVLGTAAGGGASTAARYVASPTGLAREAAQPLPRRTPKPPVLLGSDGTSLPAGGVAPTVGPAVSGTR
jgi:hypothetical protein